MSKSPSLRRIQADVRELALDPSDRYYAAPCENDMFEWHFTIRGADGTDFEGGVYHGRILLPPEYPFKPPHIVFLTPSGRFETNTKICLSFSAFHPELWQPAWGIRLILEALISFLPTPADGAIGALDWSSTERKRLAKASQSFVCPTCGKCMDLLPKLSRPSSTNTTDNSTSNPTDNNNNNNKSKLRFAKEIAELQRLQQLHEGVHKQHPQIDDNNNEQVTVEATEQQQHEQQQSTGSEAGTGTTLCQGDSQVSPNDHVQTLSENLTEEALNTTSGNNNVNNNNNAGASVNDLAQNNDEVSNQTTVDDNSKVNYEATKDPMISVQGENNTIPLESLPQSIIDGCNNNKAMNEPVQIQEPTAETTTTTAAEETTTTTAEAAAAALPPVVALDDPSWMYDPLLNLMILLMAIICYLLAQKYQSLMEELNELQQLEAAGVMDNDWEYE